MDKKEVAQGYDIAPYSDVPFGTGEAFKVLKQTVNDLTRDAPAHAIHLDMTGDKVKIHYLTYVYLLPVHMKQIEAECDAVFKSTVSYLKKEFKARTRKTLKLKEVPELAGHTAEKVSLNERYYYKAWRFYDLSWS
jgi:uncharacterized protein with von Willebrand factor type A (vWA) domain